MGVLELLDIVSWSDQVLLVGVVGIVDRSDYYCSWGWMLLLMYVDSIVGESY